MKSIDTKVNIFHGQNCVNQDSLFTIKIQLFSLSLLKLRIKNQKNKVLDQNRIFFKKYRDQKF
jgi:hypothetical protein